MKKLKLKYCSGCDKEHSIDCFGKEKNKTDGLRHACKKCTNAATKLWCKNNTEKAKASNRKSNRKYRENNTEKEKVSNRKSSKKYRENNSEKIKAYKKEYRKNNPKKVKAMNKKSNKKYRENNLEKEKVRHKKYYEDNKEKIYNYVNNRYKNDIQFKLTRILRRRLWSAIQGNFKSGSAVRDLGCSIEFLKEHLEKQFQEDMTWDNHGLHGWHVDHIKPLTSFDLTDREQLLEACHYTNLQPLWAKDNISKGNR